MNIRIPRKYQQLITEASRDRGVSQEDFIVKAAIQIAEIQKQSYRRQDLEKNINDFIEEQKPSITNDLKFFWSSICKSLPIVLFDILFWVLFIIHIGLLLYVKYFLIEQSNTITVPCAVTLIILLCLSYISVIFYPVYRFLFSSDSIYSNAEEMNYQRMKEQENIDDTDTLAKDLSKYSLSVLKLESENIKQIIYQIERRDRITLLSTTFLSIGSLLFTRYVSEEIFDYLTKNFSQLIGNISFVAFLSASLSLALNLKYFNNLPYYKQALSGL